MLLNVLNYHSLSSIGLIQLRKLISMMLLTGLDRQVKRPGNPTPLLDYHQ